ncbi:hypothetical protein D3C84_1090060 [compost metagenome]
MLLAIHGDRDGHAGNVLLLHDRGNRGIHRGFDLRVSLIPGNAVTCTEEQSESAAG